MKKTETIWVSSTRDLRDALAAGYVASQLGIPDLAEARESARAEGFSNGVKQGYDRGLQEAISAENGGLSPSAKKAIQTQERERIFQIQALTEDGFSGLAHQAIETGVTVERFAVMVLMEKKDRGITLEQIRNGAPVAAAHGGVPSDESGRTPARTISPQRASEIYEKREAAMSGQGQR